MSIKLREIYSEIKARIEEADKLEELYGFLQYIERKIATSSQIHQILDKMQRIINDFLESLESVDAFHPHFSALRIRCFRKIIEQTIISILIECNRLTRKRQKYFGKFAIFYLKQTERNQLLRFWYKQNTVKDQIKSVLGNWQKDTISIMLDYSC
jgi:hypothetical protein